MHYDKGCVTSRRVRRLIRTDDLADLTRLKAKENEQTMLQLEFEDLNEIKMSVNQGKTKEKRY